MNESTTAIIQTFKYRIKILWKLNIQVVKSPSSFNLTVQQSLTFGAVFINQKLVPKELNFGIFSKRVQVMGLIVLSKNLLILSMNFSYLTN